MTKTEIVEKVYEKVGLSKPDSVKLVEQVSPNTGDSD